MKKVFYSCLASILALSTLMTGCGNGQTSSSKASSAAGSEASSTIAQEPYTVKWYMIGPGVTPDISLVEDRVAELCKDINTKVSLNYISFADYKDKISLIIQSGEEFDMCFTSWSRGFNQFAAKGAFIDLSDIYETKLPEFSKVIDPVFLDAARVGGKLYALASNKETYQCFGFDVDKEYTDQMGIDLTKVKTLEEMGKVLATAKEKMPDITPLFMGNGSSLYSDRSWDQIGDNSTPGTVFIDDSQAKVVNQFETPEMMTLWKTAYEWMNAGYINSDAATTTDAAPWNNRKALSRSVPIGVTPTYLGSAKNTIYRVLIGDNMSTTNANTGAMIAFSKTSPDPDRAMQFYDKFATDSELYNTICYGLKDKHYKITDTSTNPQRESLLDGQDSNTVGYSSGGNWTLGGNWFLSYLSPTDPADRNELVQKGNKSAKVSPILGFTFDPSSVQNEIAACTNVVSQYYVGLSTGTLDPDKYASVFISKLKESGSDKIIAEKQRQVDSWKLTSKK